MNIVQHIVEFIGCCTLTNWLLRVIRFFTNP